jgi:hypothetical protein
VTCAGDAGAPVFKPGHARKPSDLARKELEPINENAAAAATPKAPESSDSDKDDTLKPNTAQKVEPQVLLR